MTSPQPLSARLLMAILVFAPVPLGGARPLAVSLLMTAIGVVLAVWAFERRHSGPLPVSLRRLWLPAVLAGAAFTWGCLQATPLPPYFGMDQWAHPLWSKAAVVLGPLPAFVSLSPEGSRSVLMRLAIEITVFFLALQLGRDRQRARWMIETLAFGGSVLALYGIVAFLSFDERILWMEKTAYRGTLTATLINRNHYATLAGLGLLCVVTTLIVPLEKLWAGPGFRALARISGRAWLLFLGGGALFTALLLTQSRGGIGATLLGLVIFTLALARLNLRRAMPVIAGLVVLALSISLGLWDRMASVGEDGAGRWAVYRASLELLSARPWLGIGLGAFGDAFGAVRPVGMTQIWTHAHCDWLELIIEWGIPAGACWLGALAWLALRCVRGLVERRRDRAFPVLGVAATSLVGTHATMDFSLQIPAVAMWYAAILGIAAAQSWSSRAKPGMSR